MVQKEKIQVLFKYWEKYGGPDFFNLKPFHTFNIPTDDKTLVEVAKIYYGEENWRNNIYGIIGKKFRIDTPHYKFDYIVKDIDMDVDGEIYRIEVDIDPNGTIKLYNNKITTNLELYKFSGPDELAQKYFPELEPGSTSYNELINDLEIDFFMEDAGYYDALEDMVTSDLNRIITKPYGAEINYTAPQLGRIEDFEQNSDMTESLFRIKQLIKFSDY